MEDIGSPAAVLDDVLVVELGSRIAAGACGSLLAQAGATVVFVEPAGEPRQDGKWAYRPLFAAGKESVVVDYADPSDLDLLAAMIVRADLVLTSSDCDRDMGDVITRYDGPAASCDFTAYGTAYEAANQPPTDAMIQAVSGVAYTTGFSGGCPVPLRVPVLEYSAGTYGAAACVAALLAADESGIKQAIDISLYDCAINSLITFLPAYFGGAEPIRLGNGHAMAVPWNAYRARDGWMLICSATDLQWRRICEAIERPEHAGDPRFATLADRLANRDVVDAILAEWVGRQDLAACAEKLSARDVACGTVLSLANVTSDPNLVHRSMVHRLVDPVMGKNLDLPGTPLKFGTAAGRAPRRIPLPNDGRETIARRLASTPPHRTLNAGRKDDRRMPLDGVRVIEIGQYTTAPLAGRHLAALGAEVIKVEPLTGDPTRAWRPLKNGLSIFFVMSNSGKTSVALDLKDAAGLARFKELVASADVFVENLKPGSMARLGLDSEALATINPRLIYCAITGFGMDSVYGQRPAFDTVVQAMSGMMDANASEGTPLKAGISAGDFMGGEVGLFAILSALRRRQRTGKGDVIDLSMQDVASWMTAPLWMEETGNSRTNSVVQCSDGHLLLAGAAEEVLPFVSASLRTDLGRDELAETLRARGLQCAPILSVSEAVAAPMTRTRDLIVETPGADDSSWPLLSSPIKMSRTPAATGNPIGPPQPFEEALLTRWAAAAECAD